jgi:hypothetical protein
MEAFDSAAELMITLVDNITSAEDLEDLELALQAIPLIEALRAFVLGNPVLPLRDVLGPPLVVRTTA